MVHRDDLVAVLRKQHDRGVDHIRQAGGTEQLPCSSSQCFVERPNLDAAQRLGKPGLARSPPPDLTKNSCVGKGQGAFELGGLETDPHRALVPLQRDQRSAVEHDTHADFALRAAGRRCPRTTVAS